MGQNPDVTIRIQRIERKLSLLYLNMDKALKSGCL